MVGLVSGNGCSGWFINGWVGFSSNCLCLSLSMVCRNLVRDGDFGELGEVFVCLVCFVCFGFLLLMKCSFVWYVLFVLGYV